MGTYPPHPFSKHNPHSKSLSELKANWKFEYKDTIMKKNVEYEAHI